MPLSLPAEDTDSNSDNDDISLKVLCKRHKMSQKQIELIDVVYFGVCLFLYLVFSVWEE
jgi:hypothetical protein